MDAAERWQLKVSSCAKCRLISERLSNPVVPFWGSDKLSLRLGIVGGKPKPYENLGCFGLATQPRKNREELMLKVLEKSGLKAYQTFQTYILKCPFTHKVKAARDTCTNEYLRREINTPCPRWLVCCASPFIYTFKDFIPGDFVNRKQISQITYVEEWETKLEEFQMYTFSISPEQAILKGIQDTWLEEVVEGIATWKI